ncbi:MAG: glutamate 5-kinase [Gammaproteobacteria bacterium]|nr:glutamate 5-kinase [Gammaproteobacteria bacterium]
MTHSRKQIAATTRWVVKVGSSLLTNNGCGLDKSLIAQWVSQIVALRARGIEVVLVSSGAVAEGMTRLNWSQRPHALHELQAAAAVGQMGLIQVYESHFQKYNTHTAQILLTHEDLADRQRYLNARSTLRTLLDLKTVPVVNENDTVAADELRFGDNDTLAALVANLLEADLLVLLTDQNGMYDLDPTRHSNAKLIREARVGDPQLEQQAAAGGVSAQGRGGMLTKVRAASKAARSGTATIIASGREGDILLRIAQGDEIGTLLLPNQEPMTARKRWLAGQLQYHGELHLDAGAEKNLKASGGSLLPVGVRTTKGNFSRGELVICVNQRGDEIARGLVNYSADETEKIIGKPTGEIETILGYIDEPELIHRDNLVLT